MGRFARVGAVLTLAALLGAMRQQQQPPGIQIFPADNPWNWDISGLAVHPNSDNYIATIGAATAIREDYSFPYTITNTATDVTVNFTTAPAYADESDPGPTFGSPANGTLPSATGSYPIPNNAPIEGGGDAHCLVVHTGRHLLYETYVTSNTGGGAPWFASCGAIFDLNSNAVRPEGWTSGDAAGLPIFPGLIRYDEAIAGTISHALRFTCSPTQNAHIYPARHDAGSANLNYPPMGLRLRLKASKDLTGYTGVARNILEGLKTHGIILADNGSDWYISTTVDNRWGATNITQIRNMHGSDFEVVVSVDASGAPILPVSGGGTGPPPPAGGGSPGGGGGGGGGGGCGLSGLEAFALVLFARRLRR